MNSAGQAPSLKRPRIVLVALDPADLEALKLTAETLGGFGIFARPGVIAPTAIEEFASEAARSEAAVIIVAAREAGAVRHLAAVLAVPVIRVPVAAGESPAAALASLTEGAGGKGEGAFATVALGEAGFRNAALLAVSILALTDVDLREAWHSFRDNQTKAVLAQPAPSG